MNSNRLLWWYFPAASDTITEDRKFKQILRDGFSSKTAALYIILLTCFSTSTKIHRYLCYLAADNLNITDILLSFNSMSMDYADLYSLMVVRSVTISQ